MMLDLNASAAVVALLGAAFLVLFSLLPWVKSEPTGLDYINFVGYWAGSNISLPSLLSIVLVPPLVGMQALKKGQQRTLLIGFAVACVVQATMVALVFPMGNNFYYYNVSSVFFGLWVLWCYFIGNRIGKWTRPVGVASKDDKFTRYVVAPNVFLTVACFLYGTLVYKVYFNMSTVMRVVVRVTIHPLLVEIVSAALRYSSPHYRGMRLSRVNALLFPAQIGLAMFGRFLIVTMDSLVAQLIVSIILSAQELFMRLTIAHRDRVIVRIFKGKAHVQQVNSRGARYRRAVSVCSEIIGENSSIVLAPLAYYLFYRWRILYNLGYVEGNAPVVETLLVGVAMQLVLELITDFLSLIMEIRLGLPMRAAWDHRFGGTVRDKVIYLATLTLNMFALGLSTFMYVSHHTVSIFFCESEDLCSCSPMESTHEPMCR